MQTQAGGFFFEARALASGVSRKTVTCLSFSCPSCFTNEWANRSSRTARGRSPSSSALPFGRQTVMYSAVGTFENLQVTIRSNQRPESVMSSCRSRYYFRRRPAPRRVTGEVRPPSTRCRWRKIGPDRFI
jgi:hypothetical protein